MPELKYVVSGDDSGIKGTFKRVKDESAKTSAQVVKDFEKTRKASAKATEGIMSDAKKLAQRNIKLELMNPDPMTGNTGSATNATNIKRAAEANAAYAISTGKVTTAKVAEAVATNSVTVAQNAQIKSVDQLAIKMQVYQSIASRSTDPARIALYNKKVEELSTEITRLGRMGKSGFDSMGNAIQKSTNGLGRVWAGLKNIALLVPGLGMAGLFAIGLEPLMKFVAGLGLFEGKINEVLIARKAMNDVTLKGNQNAQAELIALRVNLKVIEDINVPLQKRRDLYQQLQKDYPSYFANLSFEQAQAGKTGSAYDRLTKSIMATARAKAYIDKITENESKILENDERDKILQEEILILKNKKVAADKRAADEIRRSNREGAGLRDIAISNELQGQINEKMKERVGLTKDTNKLTLQSIALEKKAVVDASKGVLTPLDKPGAVKPNPELAAQTALQGKLNDLHDQALKKQMSDDDQELEAVRLKYKNIREEVEAYYKKYKKLKVDASQLESDEQNEINSILKRRRNEEGREEAERFQDLLKQFTTYSDERKKIMQDANTAADKLLKEGFDEQAKLAIKAGEDQVSALDEKNIESWESYKKLFGDVENLTKRQTLVRIEELEKQLQAELATGTKTKDAVEAVQKEINKLKTGITKDSTKDLNGLLTALRQVATDFDSIDGSIGNITSGLLNSARAYIEIKEGLKIIRDEDASKTDKIASGVGIAGAALAVINNIVGYFKGLKKAKEEARKTLEDFQRQAIKGELEYQALLRKRDMDQVTRGKNTYRAIVSQLDLLKAQSPKIQAAYDKVYASLQGQSSVSAIGYRNGTLLRKAKTWDIMASLAGADYSRLEELYTQGKLKDQAKADFEALRSLKDELQAAGLEVEKLQSQLNELLTGTTTSGLADGLTALFENGKFAAQDFASSFEEIMRRAIVNSFRLKVMEDAMQPFYEEFGSLFTSGTPTEDQINQLKAKYNDLGQKLGQQFQDLEKITGRDLSSGSSDAKGLRGGIQALTETTGNQIVGAFNGVQLSMRELVGISKTQVSLQQQHVKYAIDQVQIMNRIEANTFRTANNTQEALPVLTGIYNNTRDSLGTQLRAAGKYGY